MISDLFPPRWANLDLPGIGYEMRKKHLDIGPWFIP